MAGDPTEAAAASPAVPAGEQRYRKLLDDIPLPAFIYDLATLGYLDVNQAAVEQYGFSREEFLAMRVTEIRPPEDIDKLLQAIDSIDHQPRRSGVWRHRRKDGSIVEMEISSRETVEQGRRARLVIAADVTERRSAERALAASERRFRALIENASDPIFIIDQAGTVSYASPAAERMVGAAARSLEGTSYKALLHEGDLEKAERCFADLAARAGADAAGEYRLGHAQGGFRTLATVTRNLLADPAVSGFVVNARDITNESELAEQLRQAQKLEAIGRLSGGIAHDFNNVLSVILSRSFFLAEDLAEDDPRRADILEIRSATERAASLTRQLLAFSRKQVLAPRALVFDEVVSAMEKMLRRLIGEDVALTLSLSAAGGVVKADRGQLEQVLMNLAANARDAMPDGGQLEVRTSVVQVESAGGQAPEHMPPGPYVLISVRDTGTGMSAEVQRHLFEPFFTTKEPGKGTGLGLSTTYGIVKQSGGFIRARSEPGKGSAFDIYLPRAGQTPPPSEHAKPARKPGGDETVLLIDDDDKVRAVAQRILRKLGYQVIAAGSGEEALAAAAGHQGAIDLVLSDVVMPGMTGPAVVERLLQARPHLAVLFMSGFTGHAAVEKSFAEGGAYLEKPFTPDGLGARVREVLDQWTR